MKKILFALCGSLSLMAMNCVSESDTRHINIVFHNAADYDIYVDRSFYYPDTSLLHQQNVTTPGWNYKVESNTTNDDAFWSRTSYESLFHSMEVLIVFVYNADSLAAYGWDYVKNNYMVSQRYDLTLNDLYRLDWQLAFPPTPEMRDIKMWPPYGTYDSLGRRVER